MTSFAQQFAVPGGSGTILLGPSGNERYVVLANRGTCAVFIGPSGVSPSSGFQIANGGTPAEIVTVRIDGSDELVAVTAGANSGVLHVFTDQQS